MKHLFLSFLIPFLAYATTFELSFTVPSNGHLAFTNTFNQTYWLQTVIGVTSNRSISTGTVVFSRSRGIRQPVVRTIDLDGNFSFTFTPENRRILWGTFDSLAVTNGLNVPLFLDFTFQEVPE